MNPTIADCEATINFKEIINGECYEGSISPDMSGIVLMCSESGKILRLQLIDCEDEAAWERYSRECELREQCDHLLLPLQMKEYTSGGKNPLRLRGVYLPQRSGCILKERFLDQFDPADRQKRIRFSLSLALACQELEDHWDDFPVQCLRLDAFLVESDPPLIAERAVIDCDLLWEECSPQERSAQHSALARLGLMCPEWFDDPEMPVGKETLRHFLAVLIFRILCGADPYDGVTTLEAYPYRDDKAIAAIYGTSATYILQDRESNPPSQYIGNSAETFSRSVCPGVKRLFQQALAEGVADPSRRPTAAQWVENQKQMLSWCINIDGRWYVPDLEQGGKGRIYEELSSYLFLCFEQGAIVPVLPDREVYNYELYGNSDEGVADTLKPDWKKKTLRAFGKTHRLEENTRIVLEGSRAVIKKTPWKTANTIEIR